MAENLGKWPSKRRPISKIRPSDGCGKDPVPLAVERWYDFPQFGGYLGNIGLYLCPTIGGHLSSRTSLIADVRATLTRTHPMVHWKRLHLIAGHPRSGTTWVGAALGEAVGVSYIFEPITITRHPVTPETERVRAYFQLPCWHLEARPCDPSLVALGEAIRAHLAHLVEHYFGGPVENLVIKIPQTERLEFFVHTLGVERVIYLRRHPFGILNSYLAADLYRGWDLQTQWEMVSREIPVLMPELVPVLEAAGQDESDRILAMAHVRNHIADGLIQQPGYREFRYEEVASAPLAEFRRMLNWLGCAPGVGLEARIRKYIEPSVPRSGFLDSEKRSITRADAWRRELAPWQVAAAVSYLRRASLDYPTPENGLEPLTAAERSLGASTYARRFARRAVNAVRAAGGRMKRRLTGFKAVGLFAALAGAVGALAPPL